MMRRAIPIIALLLSAGIVTGCGGDHPSSYQDLIFGTWLRQDPASETVFAEITFTRTGNLVGTFVGIVEGTDPDTGDPNTAEVQGTMQVQGSTLVLLGSIPGQPAAQSNYTFSIDDDVLTLVPEFRNPEIYVRQ